VAEPGVELSWPALLPRPVEVVRTKGAFEIGSQTVVVLAPGAAGLSGLAELLAVELRRVTGHPLPVTSSGAAGSWIEVSLDPALPEEGYELAIEAGRISLRARTAAGVFYAGQTLLQLLPPVGTAVSVPASSLRIGTGVVRDRPRFAWRGLMIDVARHFFPREDLERLVDLAARYKLNRLHVHLTDDQGWRLALTSWPRLAEVGGATAVGGGAGGAFAREDWMHLLAYAAERSVTVVPEIDLPGHVGAALASYPELNCDGVAPPVYTGTMVGMTSLCLGRPETERFVREVLAELAELTPGPTLHLGGDEPRATAPEEYVTFVRLMREIVAGTGKQLVGWEETARAGAGAQAMVQHWIDEDLTRAAAGLGQKVLLSPATRAYLDMKYDSDTPVGTTWAGFVDVRAAYDWDPGTWLEGVPEAQIAGVEAALWTETVTTRSELDLLVFPRLLGHAELGWSPAGSHDVEDYLVRLAAHGPRLSGLGVGYYRSTQVAWP
jgi:hexosaminidase